MMPVVGVPVGAGVGVAKPVPQLPPISAPLNALGKIPTSAAPSTIARNLARTTLPKKLSKSLGGALTELKKLDF